MVGRYPRCYPIRTLSSFGQMDGMCACVYVWESVCLVFVLGVMCLHARWCGVIGCISWPWFCKMHLETLLSCNSISSPDPQRQISPKKLSLSSCSGLALKVLALWHHLGYGQSMLGNQGWPWRTSFENEIFRPNYKQIPWGSHLKWPKIGRRA